MESNQQQVQVNWRKFSHLIRQTQIPKRLAFIVVGLSLIQAIAGLVVPWFTKDLVDILAVSNWKWEVFVLLIVAFIVQGVAGAFSTYFLSFLGERVVSNLRRLLWNKMLALPISYFDEKRTGETVSRINNDTAVIKSLITDHLVSLFSSIISIIGAVIILFYLDWPMTLMMFSAIPIVFLIMRPMGRKMYEISKRLQEKTAHFTSLLTQVVTEIRLVKAYTAEEIERKNGEREIENLFRFGLKEARVVAVLQPLMSLVMMFVLVIIIGYGGMRVATGALTAGELVAFILYLFQILAPMVMVARLFTSLQKAMGATERIIKILEHEEEEQKEEKHLKVDPTLPIVIDRLSFAYPTSDEVLKDVSFTIPAGRVTAIVGPSGGGKTTLFALLERFYQPTKGEIRLGDTPIDQFCLHEWRRHIGYVLQDNPLLAGTVRENICYGMDREVSDQEIERAARLAYADEFIHELPQGYDTEVGERGVKLSGGQRQRIAIARAILHDPKILMLDEATSNLDSTSEQAVQEALHNLMKGRTTIVIAHRLATVVDADQIIVLEKGRVTGQGTHEELLQSHQLYQKLVKHQFKVQMEK
ncbi:ABC transporter ATP-binding protein [Thermoflavimicrobium dichotomicum]|uniref:ATP-binding cassette, subfamily B, AbcA/BmrA n=1 Tax=Thermoflavimicrobium dichotomicum TaxID=46223 RepID=A0A1I3RNY0_9BACL|nr:ABC transporter ATP-binding protein [Thermoflavimicrobium dichotomicum]SFJ47489.1 ATP-binding cassette, subfamily B, AbcA/BmrA [Thermoflavimicrobium dichotomicum]